MQKLMILFFLCFPAFPQAPVPEALLKAKTAFVVNDGAEARSYDSFYNELKKWGRFELVQEKEKADIAIVLSVRQEGFTAVNTGDVITGRPKNKFYLRISKIPDDSPLWSDSSGDWLTNPKHLVTNLKKRIEGKKK